MTCCVGELASGQEAPKPTGITPQPELSQFVRSYCLDCHNQASKETPLSLEGLLTSPISQQADHWENVVRKLQSRQMPPPQSTRPSPAEYENAIASLTKELDRRAEQQPNPGHVETFRRLTRTEYRNSIRDLLGLEISVNEMLPGDEASHGFDNVTVTNLSPMLLDRYVSAARKISRLAVGVRAEAESEDVYRIPPDVTQDVHMPGAPLGTRGGAVIEHNFPQTGEYEIQVRLMRDRNDEIESLRGKHEIDVLVDREFKGALEVKRPRDGTSDKLVDSNLIVKVQVTAGPHQVAVVFPETSSSLQESVRQPLNVHFNFYRHPRIGPAVYQISIRGPYKGVPPTDTPSRRRIFTEYPTTQADQQRCAEKIISKLARRAYRRELTTADLEGLLKFYHQAAKTSGFDVGIESAVSAILTSPHFLFRIERQASESQPNAAYSISDAELATRLSFFLWSSLPDDELLDLAKAGS